MKSDPNPPAEAGGGEGGAIIGETTIEESLGLASHQMRVIDLKIGLVQAIREKRKAAKLSQQAVADRMGVSRPRVVELERGDHTTTLDTLFAAYFAVGGTGAGLGAIGAEVDAMVGK